MPYGASRLLGCTKPGPENLVTCIRIPKADTSPVGSCEQQGSIAAQPKRDRSGAHFVIIRAMQSANLFAGSRVPYQRALSMRQSEECSAIETRSERERFRLAEMFVCRITSGPGKRIPQPRRTIVASGCKKHFSVGRCSERHRTCPR